MPTKRWYPAAAWIRRARCTSSVKSPRRSTTALNDTPCRDLLQAIRVRDATASTKQLLEWPQQHESSGAGRRCPPHAYARRGAQTPQLPGARLPVAPGEGRPVARRFTSSATPAVAQPSSPESSWPPVWSLRDPWPTAPDIPGRRRGRRPTRRSAPPPAQRRPDAVGECARRARRAAPRARPGPARGPALST